MKLAKTLALGALALATVGSSYATTVKVTGSTAYRKALYAGIIDQLGGASSVTAAYVGSSLSGANQAIFTNGTDTVIACMAGSVGGINWVANKGLVATVAPFDPNYSTKTATAWLDSANLTGAAHPTLNADKSISGGGTAIAAPVWSAASTADFTMSDSLQSSTPYTSPALIQATGGSVGVVEFMFAKGDAGNIDAAANARFTNITALGFQNLVANGKVSLAAFTGNVADTDTLVCLVGRDNDSGTRLAAAFETGLNDVNYPMNQFKVYDSSNNDVGSTGSGQIADIELLADTHAGYSGGGSVKNALNATVSPTATINGAAAKFILVGYLGTGDKPSASSKFLSYNGVAWDNTGAATQLGQYTFWTYEQAYFRSDLDTTKKTLVNNIVKKIRPLAAAANGVTTASMECSRSMEGAVVVPSY